jgi:SAM-dependent methyltransferase
MKVEREMTEALHRESERLARSWMQRESAWLKDYMVAGVEDPRLNVQSILSRHFLIRALTGERFAALMENEFCFAAAMNWLMRLPEQSRSGEEAEILLDALRRGSDNAEGFEIPRYVLRIFFALQNRKNEPAVPNYIDSFLTSQCQGESSPEPYCTALDTFAHLWIQVLSEFRRDAIGRTAKAGSSEVEEGTTAARQPGKTDTMPQASFASSRLRCSSPAGRQPPPRLSVLEPACGSANDYRFFVSFGLAPHLDYTGFDLCAKNIDNALRLFPQVDFRVANAFAIPAPDKAFDVCIVHDLFEHLSLEGLARAVKEICRVTRQGICAGFFQMGDVSDHVVRPVDEYHWNLLSLHRTEQLFAENGFRGQVLHIGNFLRQYTGCADTHNPDAYTLLLQRL